MNTIAKTLLIASIAVAFATPSLAGDHAISHGDYPPIPAHMSQAQKLAMVNRDRDMNYALDQCEAALTRLGYKGMWCQIYSKHSF